MGGLPSRALWALLLLNLLSASAYATPGASPCFPPSPEEWDGTVDEPAKPVTDSAVVGMVPGIYAVPDGCHLERVLVNAPYDEEHPYSFGTAWSASHRGPLLLGFGRPGAYLVRLFYVDGHVRTLMLWVATRPEAACAVQSRRKMADGRCKPLDE